MCEDKYKAVEYKNTSKKHHYVDLQQCALDLLDGYDVRYGGIPTVLKQQQCHRNNGKKMIGYVKSEYKEWLLCDDYVDFDIYNASYAVFASLAKQYNVECRYLLDYYENRDKYTNGSKKLKKEYNIRLNTTHKGALKHTIDDDINRLYKVLKKVPKYTGIYTELDKKKENNIQGKFMSRVYFQSETEIFNAVIKHIADEHPVVLGEDLKKGYELIPEWDGFFLRKENLQGLQEEFLEWLNESLSTVVPQWNIRFCIKEHKPTVDVELHHYDCHQE